ncbi:MAG: adenylosuccinate lyase [Hydrogenophilus sp.]|nr:adenylosuccinate lyase [Hydrogenophilus sp.]
MVALGVREDPFFPRDTLWGGPTEEGALWALSPVDGRYASRVNVLRPIFSEFGLIHARVRVEVGWFLHLAAEPAIAELPSLPPGVVERLEGWVRHFSPQEALAIKGIEREINHDVKAVEYWLKRRLSEWPEVAPYREFVHFALTSEDVNNVAYGLMVAAGRRVFLSLAREVVKKLRSLAHAWAAVPMVSRTHGQPATPTTVGKELANIVARMERGISTAGEVALMAKFNGAVGNYNAHRVAYPEVDWERICRAFVEGLGLSFNAYSIQIEPHDSLAALADALARLNTVLLDAARDLWGYIALGYFRQRVEQREVGSSTMPHKVNPIDFENAEGNVGVANALWRHFAEKLPVSRWQRDLSDSTVLRNLGVAFAHTLLAWESFARGLDRLALDEEAVAADLDEAWELLAEAVQVVMRRYGLPEPYEQLKALTRGKRVREEEMRTFIAALPLPERVKEELLALSPRNYIGSAVELARRV